MGYYHEFYRIRNFISKNNRIRRAIQKKPRNEGPTHKESAEEVLKEFFSDGLVDLEVKPLNWWAKYQEEVWPSSPSVSSHHQPAPIVRGCLLSQVK